MKPKILTDAEIDALLKEVAVRDDYRCVLCDREAHEIHHIICRSHAAKSSEKVWQLKNMASLCVRCHLDCHMHPKLTRKRLLKRLQRFYSYGYSMQPWRQYLIEEDG